MWSHILKAKSLAQSTCAKHVAKFIQRRVKLEKKPFSSCDKYMKLMPDFLFRVHCLKISADS